MIARETIYGTSVGRLGIDALCILLLRASMPTAAQTSSAWMAAALSPPFELTSRCDQQSSDRLN
ncbi:hypothetical protein SynBIOSE41_01422 [Synechococcus sp. BIOS-E4-1]|nr:hypothetical protein SynBIOSE41_01422 [Synechococcus sp. BIOS-E4-1]